MPEAFTTNRTIATKMIVMSNELRTRGSMPGATRSEIIARSSACTAIRMPPFAGFVASVTIKRPVEAAQVVADQALLMFRRGCAGPCSGGDGLPLHLRRVHARPRRRVHLRAVVVRPPARLDVLGLAGPRLQRRRLE